MQTSLSRVIDLSWQDGLSGVVALGPECRKISRLLLDTDPGQKNMSESHSSSLSAEQVEVNAGVTHQKSFLINESHKWKWSLR